MHAFTVSDWGGKYSGITKKKLMKLFLDLDESDEILDALSYLGESLDDPTKKIIKTLEKFVCRALDLYSQLISAIIDNNILVMYFFRSSESS